MKRASYREAIAVIAYHDKPSAVDALELYGLPTVMLVAQIFRVSETVVANNVIALRVREKLIAKDAAAYLIHHRIPVRIR